MAKLKNPLLSLKASGSLGRVITFLRRGKVNLVEKKPEIKDVHSDPQLGWRHMFNKCVDLWHLLSAAEKAEWESAARSRHMTGYAWYMSQCLRPNPGIYLPLQGGTMSGDIDMAKNRVLKLPAPLDAQEPARKTEIDALDIGEGHITILPFNYDSIGQGTWLFSIDPSQALNCYWTNSTKANGDNYSLKVFLSAGTYTLRVLYRKDGDGTIQDIDIDGVEVTSWDTYNAAIVRNSTHTQTGIVIASSGLKTLRVRCDGKNPASTGFRSEITTIVLWRTA